MKRMTHIISALVSTALLLGAASYADEIKGLSDPTRPPPGLMPPPAGQAGDPSARGMQAEPAASAASAPPPEVALSLDAIRYSETSGEAVALINEELVRPGDKVANMTVLSIAPNEVLLKGAAGVKRLKLLPSADEAASQPAPKKVGAAKRGRKEVK